jgi:hypothetical protein
MKNPKTLKLLITSAMVCLAVVMSPLSSQAQSQEPEESVENLRTGKFLFERETFGGNGRTRLTCHGSKTGTISSEEAQRRFAADPHDPLFLHDGSETTVRSPDPRRVLITGDTENLFFDSINAFKTPTLWGVSRTAPYFHDNSAFLKTL